MLQMFNTNYKPDVEKISQDSIWRYIHAHPRRVCIYDSEYTKDSLFFNPPFKKAIEAFFYDEFRKRFDINRNKKYYIKYSHVINRNNVIEWTNKYRNTVFINDVLPLSVALAFYKRPEGNEFKYTRLGNIVYAIKYKNDTSRINTIVDDVVAAISSFPYYKEANYICAVPPSNGKIFDLPTYIATEVSNRVGKTNISPYIKAGTKQQLKQIPLESKITELFQWDILVNCDIRDKTIVLIDDLYQSGATMMYIAMKLQQAGAKYVYGLSIVKNLKNTDNC